MLKAISQALIISMTILTLTGCSQLSPSLDDMSKSYQTVIEKYDREGMFLNIVRASKKLPLSFLTIPSITGSGSVAESAGVGANVVSTVPGTAGGFLSAGTGTYYSPTLGISLSRSFTFTQSSLDNAAFVKSFTTPIPLIAVNAMTKATDDKRELLYSLLIDTLITVDTNGTTQRYKNNPMQSNYTDFQNQLHQLIELGLSTEVVEIKEPVGTQIKEDKLNEIMFKYLDMKEDKSLTMRDISLKGAKQKTFQMYQIKKIARFCFANSPEVEKVKMRYGEELLCHELLDTADSDLMASSVNNTNKKEEEFGIVLRSTAGIFNFLGNVVEAQTGTIPVVPTVWSYQTIYPMQTEAEKIKVPILLVNKNKMTGRTFAEINYEGDSYAIPTENAGYSTQVMSFLSGFIALSKVLGAVPQSPAVLIR